MRPSGSFSDVAVLELHNPTSLRHRQKTKLKGKKKATFRAIRVWISVCGVVLGLEEIPTYSTCEVKGAEVAVKGYQQGHEAEFQELGDNIWPRCLLTEEGLGKSSCCRPDTWD